MNSRQREGFVLPMTLFFVAVAAVILGAAVGYVMNAARFTREAVARDQCRFAAQSAIEQAKVDIQEGFSAYIAAHFSSIKISPRQAKAFNWFDTVSADRRTVGTSPSATIFDGVEYPVAVNGCRVWVGIGSEIEHETDGATAVVPLVATAEREFADGRTVSVTIGEWLVFGTGQSRVFDNAYFVNNYGWMSGNFTINGEFRANGNVSLKNGAVVNGFIYAAPNAEIGALGTATLGSVSIWDQTRYRSNTGTRARYDTGNVDELGAYAPATVSGSITAATYDDAGNLTGGSHTADNKAIVNQTQTIAGEVSTEDPVEMPFVSDLAPYVEFAREEGGTLSYPSVSYVDAAGTTHTTAAGTISAYRSLAEAGPSGDASMADAGSVLLVGTTANPIRINGPVVVDGDVIIKGCVTGQGTIYAGRNVHIVGDITYLNAPSWSHSASDAAATAAQTANESKDMLGLVAKGNIVVGDATSSTIASTVNGVSESYACDATDAAIGYNATFDGNYSATERVTGLASGYAAAAVGGYDAASGQYGKVRGVSTTTYETYTYTDSRGRPRTGRRANTVVTVENRYDRKYYETCCDDRVISTFLTASVRQIDAVLYNNHGVFGTLGANFAINGALVCRDEGLTGNGGSFNWDMRLRRKRDSSVVSRLGLPKGVGDPYTCRWMELPDSANPLYVAAKGGAE